MAKIGLKRPVYAAATETDSAISYSAGAVLAKGINANISITTNDVKLYADDAIAESDHSFSSGTITIEVDNLANAAQLALLGYTEGSEVDASTGAKELKASGNDSPAYVGFGFYGKKVVSGVNYWRAIWLKKVQFKEPADEMKTKGESVEFGTASLEGTIMIAADGFWKEEGTFDTENEASTWLNTKAGIGSGTTTNLSGLTFSAATLVPTFAAATRNYYATLSGTSTTLTATFADGTAKLYVDGTYVEDLTTATASSAISVTSGTAKLIEIVVKEAGKTAITYSIMAYYTT